MNAADERRSDLTCRLNQSRQLPGRWTTRFQVDSDTVSLGIWCFLALPRAKSLRAATLDCGKTDNYRREVCVVMVEDQNANLAQVKSGMAWWYRKYQKEQTALQKASYEAAEATAKAGGVGLWSEPDPLPPWEWRHK